MIAVILFVLLIMSIMCFEIFGDIILAKTKLKNAKRFTAEIIYFTEIERMGSRYGPTPYTVVQYSDNGVEKKAVFNSYREDKLGGRIEIVANDRMAVRNEILYPTASEVILLILRAIPFLLVWYFLYQRDDALMVLGTGFLLFMFTFYCIVHFCKYESVYEELKKELHW